MSKRRDYYEVLGVEQTATEDEIKSAYKKQLAAAYGVLKDPVERRWYDQHRDLILEGLSHEDETIINLYEFFNRDCFNDFDESDDGFYTVYGDLFNSILEEEGGGKDLWSFGDMNSEIGHVKQFYEQWTRFNSKLNFWSKMPNELSEAPNRTIRRIWEKENKKVLDKLRSERTQNIRQLVLFVQRLDPRWVAVKEEMKRQREEREKRNQQIEINRKAREAERQRKRELEGMDECYVIPKEEEEELERLARFYSGTDGGNQEEQDEEEVQEFYCVVCEKTFKSENQMKTHENSKKHKQMVKLLKKEMAKYS
ncbi:DnaJ domain containing protein [Entamoeba marina]